jgi:hypothetical protein
LRVGGGGNYLARYFTGEEAGRIAASGEGSGINHKSRHAHLGVILSRCDEESRRASGVRHQNVRAREILRKAQDDTKDG